MGWSRAELALVSGVSLKALQRIENERVNPRVGTLDRLGRALRQGGVIFLAGGAAGGEGVRRVSNVDNLTRRARLVGGGMPFRRAL